MLFGHNGIVRRVVRQYFKLGIPQSAAELSYFLLFSFCPILMFLTAALARINLSEETIYTFTQLLPESIQLMIQGYIDYISNQPSIRPLLVGTLLTLYFLARAVRSMMYTIYQIYDIEDHKTIIYRWIINGQGYLTLTIYGCYSCVTIAFPIAVNTGLGISMFFP